MAGKSLAFLALGKGQAPMDRPSFESVLGNPANLGGQRLETKRDLAASPNTSFCRKRTAAAQS